MINSVHEIIRLLGISGIGPRRTLDLLNHFKTPADIFSGTIDDLTQVQGISRTLAGNVLKPVDEELLAGQLKLIEKFEVEIIPVWDDSYPESLRQIYDPPVALFCRGNLDLLSRQGVAVVGTRTPTQYGQDVTRELCKELGRLGNVIISGAARGIDTVAHKETLAGGHATIAVLGNGVDRIYPSESRKLFDELSHKGLLVSEFLMGSKPDAVNFPRRNRIISGLARGVLVVEAAEKSGSLITAYFALDQNREVFAVPGSIHSKQSRGTNRLIRQGAKLVSSVEDILEELGERFKLGTSRGQTALDLSLDPVEEKVFKILDDQAMHVDDIAAKVNMTTFALLGILLQLEMKGIIQQLPGKQFLRRG